MIDACTRITLDVQEIRMPVVVKAKRSDTGRKLLITLADGGMPYEISEDCYATFTGKKADKTKINNSCTIKNNVIEYVFTDQTCAAVGRMTAEIKLYGSDNKMLTSASFILEVHDAVFNEGDAVSKDEMDALNALILRGTDLINKLENAEIGGAVDKDTLQRIINDYLKDNPPAQFETDEETLVLEEGILSVNTINGVIEDDPRPITSGAVYDEFSKAVALLKTI